MKNYFTIFLIGICTSLLAFSFAQEKTSGYVNANLNPDQTFTKYKNDPPLSAERQNLLKRINEIKSSNDLSKAEELNQLVKKFNQNNGLNKTSSSVYGGKVILGNNQSNKPTTGTHLIFPRQIKSFATATEQSGTDKGRVWVVFTHGFNLAGPDTLDIYFTWDGEEYVYYGSGILGANDQFQSDLDVEIIEKQSGEKMLYAFYTYHGNNGYRIGGVKFRIDNTDANIFSLTWPGQSSNEKYYDVHITSDNSFDSTSTWIYIACSMDSVGTNSNWFYGQKFAFIEQTTQSGSPIINYRAQVLPVYWQSGDHYNRFLNTDIAYYLNVNNEPRLMFTYSNIPDSTKIWLSNCAINGTNAMSVGTLGSTHNITSSAIAAPGNEGNSQLMVVGIQNFANSGDWDLVSYKTPDGGLNWEMTFIEGFSSTTDRQPILPDIFCKRNDLNNYRVSYTLGKWDVGFSADSVMFVKSIGNSANSWDEPIIISYDGFSSKAGFIGNTNDDCFILWSNKFVSTLYATYCALTSAVEDDGELPNEYALSNNYPNPFNPSTKIGYKISESAQILLKIYDMLGREVATLVNEEKPAGEYQIEFDASGLSSGVYYFRLQTENYFETKKMILLR
ncbi:MAG: hypothetical protein Kow0098_15270 [Ignavibacteriaceae bacterium]